MKEKETRTGRVKRKLRRKRGRRGLARGGRCVKGWERTQKTGERTRDEGREVKE